MFKYRFAKGGYTNKDENYVTPTDYKIRKRKQTCFESITEWGGEEAFAHCTHSDNYFFFKHIFGKYNVSEIDYHQSMAVRTP